MNTEKIWNFASTGTKVHAFINGKNAACRSSIARPAGDDMDFIEVKRGDFRFSICANCEKKFNAANARVEASMMPSTGEGDHPEPATEQVAFMPPVRIGYTMAEMRSEIKAAREEAPAVHHYNATGGQRFIEGRGWVNHCRECGRPEGQGNHFHNPAETTAQRNERLTREHQDRLKSDPSYRQALADEFTGKTPAAKTRGDGVEREYTIRDEPQQKEEQTMKTTRSHLSPATITVRLDVADGPVHNQAFSTRGRMFQVERVSIEYKQDPATDVWLVQSEYDITVSGATLKRDGTPSKNDHSRNPGCHFNGLGFAPTPEWAWLNDVIERYAPIGGIAVPE